MNPTKNRQYTPRLTKELNNLQVLKNTKKILKNTEKQQLSITSYTLQKSPYNTGPEGIPTNGVIL